MKSTLDIVTYTVVYLRRCEQIVRRRTDSAREHGRTVVERQNPFLRGFDRSHLALWRIAAAGVSLFATGARKRRPFAGSNRQDGVHSQAARRPGRTNQTTGPGVPANDQRGGCRSFTGLFGPRKKTWLTPVAIAYVIANFNTIRIVSPSKSWRWSIGFWCPISSLTQSSALGQPNPQ